MTISPLLTARLCLRSGSPKRLLTVLPPHSRILAVGIAVLVGNLCGSGVLRAQVTHIVTNPTYTGLWEDSGLTGFNNSFTKYTRNPGASAQWNYPTNSPGLYRVSVYKVAHSSNNPTNPYGVRHSDRTSEAAIRGHNEGASGWIELGTYEFSGAGSEHVKITHGSNSNTVSRASAVRFVEITTNGNDTNGTRTDVGTWFMPYYNTNSWNTNTNGLRILPLTLATYQSYNSTNTNVIREQLDNLAEAQIDFLLIDLSNGGLAGYNTNNNWVTTNVQTICREINNWNTTTTNAWKIKYAIAIGSWFAGPVATNRATTNAATVNEVGQCIENQAAAVYSNFVTNPNYGGLTNYYQISGKPLLVVYDPRNPMPQSWDNYTNSKANGERFSIRYAGYPGNKGGLYGWYFPNVTTTQNNDEVELVMPGWYNHNTNYTRVSRGSGNFYFRSWDKVLNNPPRIVMILSFNDWSEETAIWKAATGFQSNSGGKIPERWLGQDGSERQSMYWDYTVGCIRSLRHNTPRPLMAGLTNLAVGTSVSVTVSSEHTGFGWSRTNLVDANRDTLFSSQAGILTNHTEWIQINLGTNREINTVALVSRHTGQWGFPKGFKIQLWNGTQWTNKVVKTNYPQPAPGTNVPFSWEGNDWASHIRIEATSLGQDSGMNYLLQLGGVEAYKN